MKIQQIGPKTKPQKEDFRIKIGCFGDRGGAMGVRRALGICALSINHCKKID